ncbi:MAG: bifunctional DNA-formamidopyrimidine glycosylase/DNA-(apurinic or apyrimidinic site) lyase [Candidatus Paceibacterota bacterium]|jgi:formamidopyrimidine-DNA glycosylase
MPELPEVYTTVSYLNQLILGRTIQGVWTSYNSHAKNGRNTIKDPAYFKKFNRAITGAKILHVEQQGKNILINLSSGISIWVHMKMTGHFLFGHYRKTNTSERKTSKEIWVAADDGPLQNSFNRFIRLLFIFSDGTHLALSDMRKFAKVAYIHTKDVPDMKELRDLGSHPLDGNMTANSLLKQLQKRPNAPIKQALMDQNLIAGIGNIYSDEILWQAEIHPLRPTKNISVSDAGHIVSAMKSILTASIKKGGDSMSDYRNPLGEKGSYQDSHKAYRRTGLPCPKKNCYGIIERMIIGGRSAHFCPIHQKL